MPPQSIANMALGQRQALSGLSHDILPSIVSALSIPRKEARRLRRNGLLRGFHTVTGQHTLWKARELAQCQASSRREPHDLALPVARFIQPTNFQSSPSSRPGQYTLASRHFHTSSRQSSPEISTKLSKWVLVGGGPVSDVQSAAALTRQSPQSSYSPVSTNPRTHRNPIEHRLSKLGRRTYASMPSSQSGLAHAERTANNNPTSVAAQSAFYSALLRANMPKIVIERYQTGRYATNDSTDAAYLKALQQTGSVLQGADGKAVASDVTSSGLPLEKLQHIAQAAAAQVKHSQTTSVTAKDSGTGAKSSPLYVVVEESFGSAFLRWLKFIVSTVIVGYTVLVLASLLVDMLGGSMRAGATQNNEVQPEQQKVRFNDVHGCDEAKEELQEVVEFLTNPDRFSSLGGKLPKGILLVGPPGTGKTLLARAVAGEAGCPFFYMSGSEFDEMYVGVGAKRVRDLFNQARTKAPAIIFIDELDAVGGKRSDRDPAYAKQTLNQLLTELDGFSPSTGVILIAATNFPKSLDKALVRPGRFDRHVQVPLPDVRGRAAILQHHMKKVAVSGDVDVTLIARGTTSFSGAQLENLVNQAAVYAARKKQKKVEALDFEWAKDKILMGAENRSMVVQQKDKIMTAYHEAGHTLINLYTKGSDPLHKVTILPRGHALGITFMMPEMDAISQDYNQYLAAIDISMGGRSAEELIYGLEHVSSGISQDLSAATKIAYTLVTQLGFSDKVGNINLDGYYDHVSPETKRLVDSEIRTIVETARARADALLREKRDELEVLKDALLEYETLNREEVLQVLRGEKINRPEPELADDSGDGKKDVPDRSRGGKPPKKETSKKGGLGIKLPDVLIPGTRRDGEGV